MIRNPIPSLLGIGRRGSPWVPVPDIGRELQSSSAFFLVISESSFSSHSGTIGKERKGGNTLSLEEMEMVSRARSRFPMHEIPDRNHSNKGSLSVRNGKADRQSFLQSQAWGSLRAYVARSIRSKAVYLGSVLKVAGFSGALIWISRDPDMADLPTPSTIPSETSGKTPIPAPAYEGRECVCPRAAHTLSWV